ncbi:MAG TPA: arginine--tRNA ligase [Tepidisphaeraceae bacterium]|jgi:arginyl-tRNA synthetase|nr:arginine--tRNA ligase [Tepidisphaeraceae bacterium]
MATITTQLETAFRSAIRAAFNLDADPLIAPSTTDKFGDYQSNAAMGLSKELSSQGQKTNPRAVADQIVAKLNLQEIATEISIAGPGFINVRLSPTWLASQLAALDDRIGVEKSPHPQTVVVDYSGPNVAKEMHVGHLRSTIIGDAISRVLEFQGHHILRQNHIGDWGTQFGMLITYLKSFSGGPQGRPHIADLEDFYRQAKQKFDADPSFADQSRHTVVRLQSHGDEELSLWKTIVEETRRSYQPIYERLSVKLTPADERGESFYNPYLKPVVDDLKSKSLAVESDGATVVPTPGFDNPLIIEKTGGGYLYATTDLAAIRFRVTELHANRIIYTHDSRQAQHFAQVFIVARLAGFAPPAVSLEYAPFGTMLGEDNKPFKTRTGGTVKLKDLLDEAQSRALAVITEKNPDLPESQRNQIASAVGIGAVKYADLSKDRTSDYVFSWDKMLAMDGNTAPYLQNAYVRIKSIFRKAGLTAPNNAQIQLLESQELALAKHILRFQEIVDLVSKELKPHLLCTYLYELATRFHSFYEHCPVLKSEEPTRTSRLALADLTARTLSAGLDLLGITSPEQM